MTDLLNIAKECGAIKTFRGITFTDHELQATVEKVCGPLVEALELAKHIGDLLDASGTVDGAISNYKKVNGTG